MVVDEKARGDRGSGNGLTVETHSVSAAQDWALIDECAEVRHEDIHLGVRLRQISARSITTDVLQASQATHQQSLPPIML
jgi:hypothetical protein